MAAILRDSVVVVAVVRTRPRAIPLAMITMRKSIHGLPFSSYMSMGLRLAVLRAAGAPLIIDNAFASSQYKSDRYSVWHMESSTFKTFCDLTQAHTCMMRVLGQHFFGPHLSKASVGTTKMLSQNPHHTCV